MKCEVYRERSTAPFVVNIKDTKITSFGSELHAKATESIVQDTVNNRKITEQRGAQCKAI